MRTKSKSSVGMAASTDDSQGASGPVLQSGNAGVSPQAHGGQALPRPGQVLAVDGEMGESHARTPDHNGTVLTLKLDPQSIVASQWANRHPDAFKSADFERLKEDIAAAGGNVQAISVRPLGREFRGKYEVVFGHRRHRACAELGIPVLATVQTSPIGDRELFALMDRENRHRADLSPYEQGLMYRRALEAGLFPSNRRLAESLGVSHTWVANVLQVADLPTVVLDCFRTPLEVQHRHAKALTIALEKDRKELLRRATNLCQTPRKTAPAAVVAALSGVNGDKPERSPGSHPLEHKGKVVGSWCRDGAGRISISVDSKNAADEKVREALATLLACLDG